MALASISHSSSFVATSQPCYSYEVFLSFQGEDTRTSFTDHLYTALKQAGIRTFRDDDAIERGKLLKPELNKAIHESEISLIVFSEGYASSKWCLDEVLIIMEKHETSSSKHEVIPVFYKVDPSDVRNQRESFKEAFDGYDDIIKAETDLEKKIELVEKVGAWRDSLRKAATLTGLVLEDRMYESKFITNIVEVIRKKLDYKALYIEDKLVGIKGHVAEIELWLQDPLPEAVILLIDGMGGIGKTTIAKCIFNTNNNNYEASCFLAKINETSNQPRELVRLQSQILSTILRSDKEEIIWDVDAGTNKVAKAISSKKVLLILDDVTSLEQIDALLGPQRFHPGSKVIITTRHKWLLTAFKDHLKVKLHSVRTLSRGDATELFSLYAFHQHQPTKPHIDQSEQVVHRCKGLPLALKVLGSSLRGKTIDVWEDTIRKLEAIPNPKIQEVLLISYETLEEDTLKELFLHIACFFEGEKEDYIVKLFSRCDLYPVVGIKNLIDRCLLYVDYDGRVKMHQLIKEMGREVVRKESPKDPGKRSRLWHHQECIDVLEDQTGSEKVEGLMIDMQKIKEAKSTLSMNGVTMHGEDANIEIGALEKMKNLILLKLNYVTFYGTCKTLPRKLRLLEWHGCSLEAIPSDNCLKKLVVLDMSHSKLKRVWDGFKFIGFLKFLNLSFSVELTKTPDFRGLPSLERLILRGCSSLIKVDESISYLTDLVLLDLTDCSSLREFPCLPRSLVSLQMFGCSNLGVSELVRCLDSSSLPSTLVHMNILDCMLFDNLFPNDWSSLVSLKNLKINGNNLTSFPKCIETLPVIERLFVVGCSKIQSIKCLPQNLTSLALHRNSSLEKVHPAQDSRIKVYQHDGQKTCKLEGRFNIQSIEKVESKIIRYLGLESNASEGLDLCRLKVLHEFGIFNTCVSCNAIRSGYMYTKRGSEISFEVPLQQKGSGIIGFNMCVVLSLPYILFQLKVEVYNKTKDLTWLYKRGYQDIPENEEKFAWLSVWRCGSLLEAGDQIVIRIAGGIAYECCIDLIYEDDKQLEGERHEDHNVNAIDQISWTDRMHKNTSDYVHNGNKYWFISDDMNPLFLGH